MEKNKIPARKSISFQTLGADGIVIDALCVEDADINSLVSVLNLCHDGYVIHIDVSETSPVSYGLKENE